MKKHLCIFWLFIKNSMAREIEFRANFIANNLINLLWAGYLIIILEVIFQQTNSLAGWSKPQMFFLLGTWMLISELSRLTFSPNLMKLADYIFEGSLDFIMTKPFNAQFVLSVNYFNLRALPMILAEIGIIIYAIVLMASPVTWLNIALYLILLATGLIINYSLLLMMMTLNFWFIRAKNMHDLWDALTNFGKYPLAIFPRTMVMIFLTFVPIGLINAFPVLAFLGRLSWGWISYALVFSLLIFYLARRFWNFAIKHYSSASS